MSDDHDEGVVDPDRAAILARRRGFLARALDGLGPVGMAGAAAAVVAASGITAACGIAQACLSMYIPPTETGESGTESETGSDSETGGSETDGTDTGTTG